MNQSAGLSLVCKNQITILVGSMFFRRFTLKGWAGEKAVTEFLQAVVNMCLDGARMGPEGTGGVR
jgi:hypothetical protein